MKLKLFLICFLTLLSISSGAATVNSGLSDDKIKKFFAKLTGKTKQGVLDSCKKDLGTSSIAGKSESQIVDLCIKNAKSNIDPLDNYIDPDTLIDYQAEWKGFGEDKKKHVLNRCSMFVIQNEMGQSGEAGMSNSEIESYEAKVHERCQAILNTHMWGIDCTSDNQSDCEKEKTTKGRLFEEERSGNLLTFVMDQCVSRMGVTGAHCEAPGGLLGASCTLDFRRQCYDFITRESTYLEDPNREIYTCANFEDQTKTLAIECRSYCYQKKVCEITDDSFINRIIGNIYLRKKKGRSSCVKDKSFGIGEDNKIWVHQSCHGEFGIQYKDPDCGYRPTCDITPFEPESINVQGTEETFVTCDGNGSPAANVVDPTKNSESTGKVWCKLLLYKKDKNGKRTSEIDDSREVSRVYNISLVDKIGPHRCNPGGNGSEVDYLSSNKGNFDGGWGVEVINYCHARFKVKVAWKQKLCTMAGEETKSGNTCCNGLIHDEETDICNVPEFISPALPEQENIPVITTDRADKNRCEQELPDDVLKKARELFSELAVYENMFTILDGQSDPIKQISLLSNDSNKDIPKNRKLNNQAIKVIHDAALVFRTEYARIKIDHETLVNTIICDMNEFMLIKSTELGVEEVTKLNLKGVKCPEISKKLAEVKLYLKQRGQTQSEQNSANSTLDQSEIKKPRMSKSNLMQDVPGIQEGAQRVQEFMMDANIAYTQAIMDTFNGYVIELDRAALIGQNLVWLCAHKENCSEFNWLVMHEKADDFNSRNLQKRLKYRVIADFLHNPIYPTQLLSSRAKILPELEPGYKKYLYTSLEYKKVEREISEQEVYRPVLNYLEAKVENISQPKWYKNVFQLYGNEYPLRSNSSLINDEVFSTFKSKFDSSTNFKRDQSDDSIVDVIPYICSEQSLTNYQVRVPLGKALVPLRMAQVTEYLYKYMEAQLNILKAQRTCTVEYSTQESLTSVEKSTGRRLNVGGKADPIGLEIAAKASAFPKNNLGTVIDKITRSGNDTGLGSNIISNRVLSMYGMSVNISAKEKLSQAKGLGVDAAGFYAKARSSRAAQTLKLTQRSQRKRNDKLIGKYVDSLDKTYGKSLSGKKSSLFNMLSKKFLSTGASSLDSSKQSSVENIDSSFSYSSDASSGDWEGGSGLSGSIGRGSRNSNTTGSNSNSYDTTIPTHKVTGLTSRETSKVLKNIRKRKYNIHEEDTIFDIITKRYIKSAYPRFLKFKKRKALNE